MQPRHIRAVKNKRFSISLRVLMLLVLIFALFSWYETTDGPWKRQQAIADSFAIQIPFWRAEAARELAESEELSRQADDLPLGDAGRMSPSSSSDSPCE